MGWSYGVTPEGKEVGYSVDSTCEHEGCGKKINRGLYYVCGDMHGNGDFSCDGYFCDEHRDNYVKTLDGEYHTICNKCKDSLLECEDIVWDYDEGVILL